MGPDWAALARAGRQEQSALANAIADPKSAQSDLLSSILTDAAPSRFGRQHHLHKDMSVNEFQAAVPICNWDNLRPWIDAILSGHPDSLTQSPVLAFELTGGSSGGPKPVPYTTPLLTAFQRGILAWFGDFLTHLPAIGTGRAYFAISPAVTRSQTLGGYPVGLGSDLAYFGDSAAHLAPLLLHDPALDTTDHAAWADATIAMLCAADDLSLISVWSPTFLTALLDRIEDMPHWPNLCMVSAWADASSAPAAADLRTRLPQARFQPKGLLATEGIFTLPLFDHPDPVPALRSTFLEFRDTTGEVHLVDDLDVGVTYDLIITTPGGLLRYAIGDRVLCTGHVGPTPMLRFAGRARTSDMVGEKLTEDFVLDCMSRVGTHGVLVACQTPARYLFVTPAPVDPAPLDAALARNPQYAYARQIGQLPLPQVQTRANLMADVCAARLAQGHRLSDIKVPVLMDEMKARAIWPDLT